MKKTFLVFAVVIGMISTMACGGAGKFQNNIDSLSYAIGMDMGMNTKFGVKDLELDHTKVIENMNDFIANGDLESEEFMKEMQQMQMFQYTKFMPYMQAKMQLENAANKDSLPELPALYDEEFTRENIASYIGHSMGASVINLKTDMGLSMPFFNEGFEDAIELETIEQADTKLRLTIDEMQQLFTAYQEKEMAKAQEEMAKAQEEFTKVYNENKEASAKWLAEVEKMDGVKKTESGILYRIDREGKGKKPSKDTDVVLVNYEGKLRTGKVFDSSYERDEPISFALNQVIKGWTEGMQLVKVGGQITLWIPAELAYGERGAGEDIGPGEALEFKVELLELNPKKK